MNQSSFCDSLINTMIENPKIWIVIPVYNQPERLLSTVEKAQKYGTVVVVDDCSLVPVDLAQLKNVFLLRHIINRGQGAALQTGTDFAVEKGADIVVHLDADGQHNPDEIPKMIEPLISERVDIVFGSRFIDQANIQVPWTKKWFIHRPAIYFHNLWFGSNLTDVHNGFRALSVSACQKIKITQDRFAHPTQILEQVIKHELKYVEASIVVSYYGYGQNFFDGFKIISDMLIRWLSK